MLIELHDVTGLTVDQLADEKSVYQLRRYVEAAVRRRNASESTMTTKQACKHLGDIHKSTLVRWAKRAGIEHKRNQWRRKDIDRLKRLHPVNK